MSDLGARLSNVSLEVSNNGLNDSSTRILAIPLLQLSDCSVLFPLPQEKKSARVRMQ
jgi:hypothetical protein